jgi:hypothetical protein
MQDQKRFMKNCLWDDDPYGVSDKTDEERIDEMVEKVVSCLDSLKVLNLGGHKSFTRPGDEPD